MILQEKYFNKLNNWVTKNGWEGWDPYDVFDNKIGLWAGIRGNINQKLVMSIMSRLNQSHPLLLRKIFGTKKKVNPKGMGLFASAYTEILYILKNNERYNFKKNQEACFGWLENNKIVKFGGIGWGYSFDWMSRKKIPKNTPTAVNSTIIGDAYWKKYKLFSDDRSLLKCKNICEFIMKGLNRTGKTKNGYFCFSYTPLDNFQVHNANLFAAEFLIRIGLEIDNQEWVDHGLLSANFSINEIREDGTLNYWSNSQSKDLEQDTYHSGFEIRSLNKIGVLTKISEILDASKYYFETWSKDFFSNSGSPCFVRGDKDITEIHSVAEPILSFNQFFENDFLEKNIYSKRINDILRNSIDLWVDVDEKTGFYAADKIKNRVNKIPYIRWGQAWMMHAFSNCLLVNFKKDLDSKDYHQTTT